jgi:hypothetical protein
MFLERFIEKRQKAPLPSGWGGFSLLFYDDWIKIGGAFQRTKLQDFDVCYRYSHA